MKLVKSLFMGLIIGSLTSCAFLFGSDVPVNRSKPTNLKYNPVSAFLSWDSNNRSAIAYQLRVNGITIDLDVMKDKDKDEFAYTTTYTFMEYVPLSYDSEIEVRSVIKKSNDDYIYSDWSAPITYSYSPDISSGDILRAIIQLGVGATYTYTDVVNAYMDEEYVYADVILDKYSTNSFYSLKYKHNPLASLDWASLYKDILSNELVDYMVPGILDRKELKNYKSMTNYLSLDKVDAASIETLKEEGYNLEIIREVAGGDSYSVITSGILKASKDEEKKFYLFDLSKKVRKTEVEEDRYEGAWLDTSIPTTVNFFKEISEKDFDLLFDASTGYIDIYFQ